MFMQLVPNQVIMKKQPRVHGGPSSLERSINNGLSLGTCMYGHEADTDTLCRPLLK
jgi:hypothetical protein